MKLKEEGLYVVVGMEFSLLCKIDGKGNFMSIPYALRLSDLMNNIVKPLNEDSYEVQYVLQNQKGFMFLELITPPLELMPIQSIAQKFFYKTMCKLEDKEMEQLKEQFNIHIDQHGKTNSIRFKVWMTQHFSITLSEANYLYNILLKTV